MHRERRALRQLRSGRGVTEDGCSAADAGRDGRSDCVGDT